jgi:hypothetical protein
MLQRETVVTCCANHTEHASALCVGKTNILITEHNTQNHWVCGLCPSSGVSKSRNHSVSETGTVSVLARGEGDACSVGSLRESQPQSLPKLVSKYSDTNTRVQAKWKGDNRKSCEQAST